MPDGVPDERFLYLSDILPTAWQAVAYADVPEEGTLAVFGLGPVGQLCARIGAHQGRRVIGVDRVPERLELAQKYGVETVDLSEHDNIAEVVLELTGGRGADGVVDAVGKEAHGNPVMQTAIKAVRRSGTVSVSGVYGDVSGLETLATHRPSLEEAPAAYEMFQQKADGCIKVVPKA